MGNSDEHAAWTIRRGDGPLVATAIHEGNRVRPEVQDLLALSASERRREEDPYTSRWTAIAPNRIVVHRSRFEVDLNRPRDGAVYRSPEEAWGLRVWRNGLPDSVVDQSLSLYDDFYREIGTVLEDLARAHGRFVVYDLHSYNYRRKGPLEPPDDPRKNPEVNVGTGSLDRERWGGVVEAFQRGMEEARVLGRPLDVRENVRFEGGQLARWIHERFPDSGCCLAVEIKKFYMDEWTGEPDEPRIEAIHAALAATVEPVLEALAKP